MQKERKIQLTNCKKYVSYAKNFEDKNCLKLLTFYRLKKSNF